MFHKLSVIYLNYVYLHVLEIIVNFQNDCFINFHM